MAKNLRKIVGVKARTDLGMSATRSRTPEFYSPEFNNRGKVIQNKKLYDRKVKHRERDSAD